MLLHKFRCETGSDFNETASPSPQPPLSHPNNATYKIWSRLANWPKRYLRRLDGPSIYYKLTSPACGSDNCTPDI